MWYMIQVYPGTEENMKLQCDKNISEEVLERCFIPYYEEKRHIRKEWITLKKILFPGRIFVIAKELTELCQSLKCDTEFTKLIGNGQGIMPLTKDEIQFLQRIGGKEQVAEMSEGIIEHSRTKVRSGPLVGMESSIRKIDRHKRKAWVEVEMFGRKQTIQMGLEITSKS